MKRARGFTLVEVLVAVALLALVATLAWRATSALVDSEVRLSDEARKWRTLDSAFARLEADIRQAQPRSVRTPRGIEPAWLAATETHGSSAIVFTRAGAEFDAEPGAAGQRIGYRVRNAALEIVYWPALDRADETSTAFALVDAVAAFRVEQLGARGDWTAAWPQAGDAGIPRAVRVVLTLASGETIDRLFTLR